MRLYNWPLTALFTLSFISVFAQENAPPTLADGYYVVVSAYRPAQSGLAKKLVDKIAETGTQADYGVDSKRNYCYVYLGKYSDFQQSLREMEKTRASGKYSDAWVRVMRDGVNTTEEITPKTPVVVSAVKPDATIYVAIPKPGTEADKKEEPVVSAETSGLVASSVPQIITEVVENPKAEPVIIPQTLANTPIFLSLFNARNNKVVDGEIEVIDTERARSMAKVKGNSYLSLPDPKSTSGELTLICNAFGYRKVQHQIHYKNTESDTLRPYVDLVGNYYLVKFDLVRLHKGDISVLYNVYFYNDAAVMMPESKSELNGLLSLMEENPTYHIRLHGHTNGNASGPIITMGPSKDFFTLTSDVNKGYGSAKELSGARAETIRQWLIAQGIAENRVDVKAWGGGRMLHDKHSAHARRNVRVEVEVVEE